MVLIIVKSFCKSFLYSIFEYITKDINCKTCFSFVEHIHIHSFICHIIEILLADNSKSIRHPIKEI